MGSGRIDIVLTEGKNRQIRRMLETVGKRVKRLKRIRIENIQLGKLQEGEWRRLAKGELKDLLDRVELE